MNQGVHACGHTYMCTGTQGQSWEQDRSDPGFPKYSIGWAAVPFPSGLKENISITLTCLPPSANTAATNAYLSFYIPKEAPCGGAELNPGSSSISLGTEIIQNHLLPTVNKGHYFDKLVKSLSVSSDDPELFSMHLSFSLTKTSCKAISVFHLNHFLKM